MKRTLVFSLAIAAIAALAGAWFVSHYDRVETRVWVGPSGAARSNPYLAAMRFAERLGMKARLAEQPSQLPSTPVRTSIVLPAGRAWLTEARAEALLRTAENGGHVIVEAEPVRARDVLLDSLAIARRSVKPSQETFDAALPGGEARLRIGAADRQVLDVGRANADIVVADTQGTRLASMRRGAGRVTAMTSMARFDNRHIGSHDHAELLRRVLALAPTDELLIVRAAGTPPLWDWLRSHASDVMAAAAILAALALWRIAPRFGPLIPVAEPARRALQEHLRAAGRFRWQQGARAALLAAARDQLERHVAFAAPRLAHLPPQRRHDELALQLGTDAATISHAFQATPRNAREMVQITATLASIHAGLRGARRRPLPRRRRR
jgi:hypothetical protein